MSSDAVEIDRESGPQPGLVIERRTDGPDGGPQQDRAVIAILEDGDVHEVDTAVDRLGEPDDPQLVRDVLARRLERDGDA